jgi:hypothetical protein
LRFLGFGLLVKLFRVLGFLTGPVGLSLSGLALLLGVGTSPIGLCLRRLLLLHCLGSCGLRLGLSLSRVLRGPLRV